MFHKVKIFIVSSILLIGVYAPWGIKSHQITLSTLYGDYTITEPVIIDLLQDLYVLRLAKIHQYGVNCYSKKLPDFSRLEHSIGVFVLLRRYGASLKEQIAGLLHDVSHTVFSHVGDMIFKHADGKSSYQDLIHENFLAQTSIATVLKQHGFGILDIKHKKNGFKALEQDLPDICADRLEYNLRGGLVQGLLTQADITQILENLKFEDDTWYFISLEQAKKFARVPLYLTEHVWTSSAGRFIDTYAAEAIRRAVDIDIITLDDVHFSTDDVVWQKLISCNDSCINQNIYKVVHWDECFTLGDTSNYDFVAYAKCRGIDPLIKIGDTLKRLSEIDEEFRAEYNRVKELMAHGYYIKLK